MNGLFYLRGKRGLALFLAASLTIKRNRLLVRSYRQLHASVCLFLCLSVSRSVGRSVRKMYCGKMADWIWMPFGVVSEVGQS